MVPIQIKFSEMKEFKQLCRQANIRFFEVGEVLGYYGKDNVIGATYKFDHKFDLDYLWARAYIAQGETTKIRKTRGAILYSLYTTNNLVLDSHPFPTVRSWKEAHDNMTLDHILPKSKFPEYALDAENWQPLTKEENRRKADRV